MRVQIEGYYTDVFPTTDEVTQLCLPGSTNTCAFLMMGPTGWECCCLHRHPSIVKRLAEGTMNAKREGCDFVNNLNVQAIGLGSHEIEVE